MKKLIKGVIDFRKNVRSSYRKTFAKLALGQSPDTLFIGCSDSRVVPNLFASTDPGDLFVIRNVGNLIPPCQTNVQSSIGDSEAAAIEFALNQLKVSDIIICGHSECGAMHALVNGRKSVQTPNLKKWLKHGEGALRNTSKFELSPTLVPHNLLSQRNVLLQLEHLKTYPIVKKRIKAGQLRLHAWWFELSQADVYVFDNENRDFILIDEKAAAQILKTLELKK